MQDITPAIPAAKNWLGNEAIYWWLIRFPLWQSFDRVWVHVEGNIPGQGEGPLICYLNHPSWWDGYMAAVINRLLLGRGLSQYVMMEEPQLRAYRFFTWAGVFSVDRHNPREAARSVAYISRVLHREPEAVLYMFPQGEIMPNDRRPLVVFPGVAHVAKRLGRAMLAPVALRYEFRGEQRPELFVRFGPTHTADEPGNVRMLTQEVEQRLTASVDALRQAVVSNDLSEFRVLLRGKPGINRLFDWLVGRRG